MTEEGDDVGILIALSAATSRHDSGKIHMWPRRFQRAMTQTLCLSVSLFSRDGIMPFYGLRKQ
jgi:hypothetical protein